MIFGNTVPLMVIRGTADLVVLYAVCAVNHAGMIVTHTAQWAVYKQYRAYWIWASK